MKRRKACYQCGGELTAKTVDQPFRRKTGWVIVRGLPVEECRRCGSRTTGSKTAVQLDRLLRQSTATAETIPVPALQYAA